MQREKSCDQIKYIIGFCLTSLFTKIYSWYQHIFSIFQQYIKDHIISFLDINNVIVTVIALPTLFMSYDPIRMFVTLHGLMYGSGKERHITKERCDDYFEFVKIKYHKNKQPPPQYCLLLLARSAAQHK